jgi:hypothetical protein
MKARPWRNRMIKRNRKLRKALRVLAKKAWSGLDRNYAARALKGYL